MEVAAAVVEGTLSNLHTSLLRVVTPFTTWYLACVYSQEIFTFKVKITEEGVLISEALLTQLEPLP